MFCIFVNESCLDEQAERLKEREEVEGCLIEEYDAVFLVLWNAEWDVPIDNRGRAKD